MATESSSDPRVEALTEDRLLVERILLRDETALGIVIGNYGRFVYGRASRVVGSPMLAEEVAQDTFLALWTNPGSFDLTKGSLKTFLLAIAKHKAIDAWRHERSVHTAEIASSLDVTLHQVDELPDGEHSDSVNYALTQLSPLQKEAIHLAYFGRLTHKQVAAVLRIPHSTAKTRVRDALITLRKTLGEPSSNARSMEIPIGPHQGRGR